MKKEQGKLPWTALSTRSQAFCQLADVTRLSAITSYFHPQILREGAPAQDPISYWHFLSPPPALRHDGRVCRHPLISLMFLAFLRSNPRQYPVSISTDGLQPATYWC
jgi:hypothetical protein